MRGATGRRGTARRAHLISIHAPREGSDPDELGAYDRWELFQSTLPVRGATFGNFAQVLVPVLISIHAPREGSDVSRDITVGSLAHFNPRSP